jgi:signal transduction histidine kinase
MISELDRANSIITEFLSISRTKAAELAQQNLNDIINNLLPLILVDATGGNKRVLTDLGEIPELLLNEKEIRQLILNLARNGLEAMEEGGCLTILTLREENKVTLAVKDEGSGISPEVLDRLGTPFFTTKDKGTGLGLAVCYGIAARHNAQISVESNSQGTIFFVKFEQKSFDLT